MKKLVLILMGLSILGNATVSDPQENYSYIPQNIDNATAIRFLNKATFGANKESIEALKSKGVVAWLDEQLSLPISNGIYLKKTIRLAKKVNPNKFPNKVSQYISDNDTIFNRKAYYNMPSIVSSSWFDMALFSPDQLRQKVTYALSQIIVLSDFETIFTKRAEALSMHFDILQKNAFGNYGDLLNQISLSAGMGVFLTYNGNQKKYVNSSGVTVYPDENYARELMQLFSIGLKELNINGTAKKDSEGNDIPSYTQEDVNQLATVFTGWDLQRNTKFGRIGFKKGDYTHPLEFTASYHDIEEKKFLGQTIASGLDGKEEIARAISIIMSNNNIAPYISKNLILRLTKSNPTPAYVGRVSSVFQTTGGDLKAVIKAILLDPELWDDINNKNITKIKEPLVAYTSFLRAFKVKAFPKAHYCFKGASRTNKENCTVNYKLYINDPRSYLNQGAGLAPNVFNFYSNDFIPNDTAFKTAQLVSPEIQIQSDIVFIKLSNKIVDLLLKWDRNSILSRYYGKEQKRYRSLKEYINSGHYRIKGSKDKMLLDTREELNVMEKVIDGNTNGTFSKLRPYTDSEYTDDEKAVDAVVQHLNQKLTGGLLSSEEEAIIANNLKEKIYKRSYRDDPRFDKRRQLLENVIYPAIRAIVTSHAFMTE